MSRKILTPGNVRAILEMRSILNEWGEPRHTGAEIAVQLGVSESTVWRVIREQAAYARRVAPSREAEQANFEAALNAVTAAPAAALEDAAQTSLAKLQAMLKEHKTKSADGMLKELVKDTTNE